MSRPAAPVVTRLLPESAHGLTLSAYWEGGWEPERFALQLIWQCGGKTLAPEAREQ